MYLYCIKTILYESGILSSCVSFIHGVPSSSLALLSLYSPVLALANKMASFANRPGIEILVLLHIPDLYRTVFIQYRYFRGHQQIEIERNRYKHIAAETLERQAKME